MDDLDRQRLVKIADDVAWIRTTLESLFAALEQASANPVMGMLLGKLGMKG